MGASMLSLTVSEGEIVKSWFGSTGENVAMNPQFVTDYGVNIHIGENFTLTGI